VVQYGVSEDTEMIDWDAFEALAHESKPKVIMGGASAYPRFWDFERMRKVADEVEATLIVDMAHFAGLVATDHHPSPVPHSDVVTTTTHKTLRGPRAGLILFREEHGKAINRAVFPGMQGGPLMHAIAAKAVAFKEAATEEFKEYSSRVVANAKALAATLMNRGVRLVSGGTDNHLLLVDLRPQQLTGKQIEASLEAVGITVNKNAVPFDDQPPVVTSGIRLGTPALTTRGMREPEMVEIGNFIADVIEDPEGEDTRGSIRAKTAEMCAGFPLFAWSEGIPG
jgi:glycine hydroxymethyltransferase